MSIANLVTAKSTALSVLGIVTLAGTTFWACDASNGGTEFQTPTGAGNAAGTGGMGGNGLSGTGGGVGGGFNPLPNPCRGHAGDLICVQGVATTCDANEEAGSEQDCADEVCVPGIGCQLCVEGQYKCEGNELLLCEANPLHWTSQTTCDGLAKQACNATQGACVTLSPIGNNSDNPTGTYFLYAQFRSNDSAFLSGYDVDSIGNYIYVNRGGSALDVYMVEMLDSDGDGEFEPNQHPDNPDDTGPMEERILTLVSTYDADMGAQSGSEIFCADDRVFFVDRGHTSGEIFEYPLGGARSTVLTSNTSIRFSMMGYDPVNDIWYAGHESTPQSGGRVVYSYHQPSNEWVAEFEYPDLTGGHFDGMEIVIDPNDGTPYVYVSDMTSDFIGQYVRERGNTWRQVNLFQYDGPPEAVEGMGFGALNHFWATGGSVLYEIGGGDLQKFTEEEPPPR